MTPAQTNQCPCLPNYYDNNVHLCASCGHTCYTCSGPSNTQCITCLASEHRTIFGGNTCPCDNRYFDNNVEICANCHYSCWVCSGANQNQCTQCQPSDNRVSTPTSNTCPCINRYFDNGADFDCKGCHFSCLTCSNSAINNCLSCSTDDKRIVAPVSNRCPCADRFYEIQWFSE